MIKSKIQSHKTSCFLFCCWNSFLHKHYHQHGRRGESVTCPLTLQIYSIFVQLALSNDQKCFAIFSNWCCGRSQDRASKFSLHIVTQHLENYIVCKALGRTLLLMLMYNCMETWLSNELQLQNLRLLVFVSGCNDYSKTKMFVFKLSSAMDIQNVKL